jgi:Sulfotransferase domain
MSLPNFLVIGAQRAGTSLLHHKVLAPHPQVYVPVQRKEVHFFDRHFERGLDWYRGYFPAPDAACRFRAIGEVTPDYLAAVEAPARIHQLLPECRLIAILRNPVDRAWSWYQHARRSRYERRDFATFLQEAPEALGGGLYHRHLQRYLVSFRREALLVLLYEELIQNPGREIGRLMDFLGVAMIWSDPAALLRERVNPSEIPRFRRGFALARRAGHLLARHDLNWPVRTAKRLGVPRWFGNSVAEPGMSPDLCARLDEFYRDDVRQLGVLLGRDLRVWKL